MAACHGLAADPVPLPLHHPYTASPLRSGATGTGTGAHRLHGAHDAAAPSCRPPFAEPEPSSPASSGPRDLVGSDTGTPLIVAWPPAAAPSAAASASSPRRAPQRPPRTPRTRDPSACSTGSWTRPGTGAGGIDLPLTPLTPATATPCLSLHTSPAPSPSAAATASTTATASTAAAIAPPPRRGGGGLGGSLAIAVPVLPSSSWPAAISILNAGAGPDSRHPSHPSHAHHHHHAQDEPAAAAANAHVGSVSGLRHLAAPSSSAQTSVSGSPSPQASDCRFVWTAVSKAAVPAPHHYDRVRHYRSSSSHSFPHMATAPLLTPSASTSALVSTAASTPTGYARAHGEEMRLPMVAHGFPDFEALLSDSATTLRATLQPSRAHMPTSPSSLPCLLPSHAHAHAIDPPRVSTSPPLPPPPPPPVLAAAAPAAEPDLLPSAGPRPTTAPPRPSMHPEAGLRHAHHGPSHVNSDGALSTLAARTDAVPLPPPPPPPPPEKSRSSPGLLQLLSRRRRTFSQLFTPKALHRGGHGHGHPVDAATVPAFSSAAASPPPTLASASSRALTGAASAAGGHGTRHVPDFESLLMDENADVTIHLNLTGRRPCDDDDDDDESDAADDLADTWDADEDGAALLVPVPAARDGKPRQEGDGAAAPHGGLGVASCPLTQSPRLMTAAGATPSAVPVPPSDVTPPPPPPPPPPQPTRFLTPPSVWPQRPMGPRPLDASSGWSVSASTASLPSTVGYPDADIDADGGASSYARRCHAPAPSAALACHPEREPLEAPHPLAEGHATAVAVRHGVPTPPRPPRSTRPTMMLAR
ncbi:hypothetical protein CXG81DRAFT_24076 [Caulochytrium protostelioides]|uniref:Uncharacterized protein n=1 Tax=Caulochytrium protostelioides TaxID=1555241 RepID=A0A4P9XCY2_9FUNG|nr:hypothetical protein CXG81DRAFT_24076 [Caulochytrium protostelioides]|eukprot:RKP03302.1 hypothetical protein CXG81DRAFT_24076 [Caulochytrium protostelioides]